MNKLLESKRIYTQKYIDSLNLKLELDEFDKKDEYGLVTKPKIIFMALSSLALICPIITLLLDYLNESIREHLYKKDIDSWISFYFIESLPESIDFLKWFSIYGLPIFICFISLSLIILHHEKNEEREKIKGQPQNEKTKNYSGLTSIEKIEKIEKIIDKSHKKNQTLKSNHKAKKHSKPKQHQKKTNNRRR